jgi:hypothetical protein
VPQSSRILRLSKIRLFLKPAAIYSAPVGISGKCLAAIALAAMLVALPLGTTACGSDEERTSGDEGEFIHVGDAVYQVQLTRLLNPRIRPDDAYLRGQPAATGKEQYLAVFMRIENKGDAPYQPPRDMKVIDTLGNQYLPLDATQSGFGLEFGKPIEPGEEAPPPNSPADEGPNAGALVLFRLKSESATNNLPLELDVPSGQDSGSRIVLDI